MPWALLLACAPPLADEARAAWIQGVLASDNEVWLSRDHALLEAKFAAMADDPYDFLRGTNALYYADLARPDPDRSRTALLRTAESLSVLVIGDPHLENLGTALPGEEPDLGAAAPPVTMEPVDLDAAGFAPWTWDTRRTALALRALVAPLAGCDEATSCPDATVTAFARGYAEEIEDRAAGGDGWDAAAASAADGLVVEGLRSQAATAGGTQSRLDAITTVTEAGRRFALDDELLAPTAEESAQLDRLLAGWAARPAGLRELDRARRFGVGVASLPAVRYLVLYDAGDDGPADDRVVQLREVVAPPAFLGPATSAPGVFTTNAERVVVASRTLWSRPDADVRLDAISDGPQTFKVQSWSGWTDTFDHEEIRAAWDEGGLGQADLDGLARTAGHLLASAHARGATLAGPDAGVPGSALPAITMDLTGREDAFLSERLADASADLARLQADHDLFIDLLDADGPLLGLDARAADLP